MRLPLISIPAEGQRVSEREITDPVDLCLPSGELNPDAIGWTRTALHRTALRGWGRNKRFEYWSIVTPTSIISMNISHHDYRANVAVTVLDRETYREIVQGGNTWLPRRGGLRDADNQTPMEGKRGDVLVRMTPRGADTHLRAQSPRISVDLRILSEPGHESMGVVVPWNRRTFQYTKKDNCLRAEGVIVIDGVAQTIDQDESYAIHDRGRGRWPYFTMWNWGAGNGIDRRGRELGLQFGGKWTDGTPSTENWIRVQGRLHKISSQLAWSYDPEHWLRPWALRGPSVDVTFTPVHHRRHLFDKWLIKSRGDMCFGTFAGSIDVPSGETVEFADVFGHVEEVERRW